jgi:ribose transport system substrate-binding protein
MTDKRGCNMSCVDLVTRRRSQKGGEALVRIKDRFSRSGPNRFALGLALVVGLLSIFVVGASATTATRDVAGGATAKLRVGLVLPDLTNQTINDIYKGAKQRAKQMNVTLLEGGTSDTPKWLSACQQIVNSHIDVLAYDTLDAASASSCIQTANKRHIKTICIFACSAKGKNDALVTLDFYNDGVLIGSWMANAVKSGEVAILHGPPGDEAATAIANGYKATIKSKCPDCDLVADVDGGHDRDTGYTAALQVLTAHPNLKGIYGLNDDIAMGIIRAVQQQNKLGEVQIAGHNGTCEALAAILNKQLNFTLLLAGQPFGFNVIDTAIKLSKGQKVKKVNVKPVPITLATAQGVLSGKIKDASGVGLKARLQTAKAGCK